MNQEKEMRVMNLMINQLRAQVANEALGRAEALARYEVAMQEQEELKRKIAKLEDEVMQYRHKEAAENVAAAPEEGERPLVTRLEVASAD